MRTLSAALLAAILISGVSAAVAQHESPAWWLSRAEVSTLTHGRPSVESCEKLTAYFRGREQGYRDQAKEMNLILMQRQITAANADGKYAQSVSAGERLRKYYLQMAHEMDTRADFWARRGQQLQ